MKKIVVLDSGHGLSTLLRKLSQAKINVCNIKTQPGESKIEPNIINKSTILEQKYPVILDSKNINGVEIISDDLTKIKESSLRHNTLQLSLDIFSYLLK